MIMAERLQSSAGRFVQSPVVVNPNRLHSIEAILGFKEGGIFHKAASYTMAEAALTKDAERNANTTPAVKKDHHSSFDGRLDRNNPCNYSLTVYS